MCIGGDCQVMWRDLPAHGRHFCDGARGLRRIQHRPGTKGGVMEGRQFLETVNSQHTCAERDHLHENWSDAALSASCWTWKHCTTHFFCACELLFPTPPSPLDSFRQRTKLSKTRAADSNRCLNTHAAAVCLSWSLLDLRVSIQESSSIDGVAEAAAAPWQFSVNHSVCFLFSPPREDYADKGRVKVQRKYELNPSLMSLRTHLNSTR